MSENSGLDMPSVKNCQYTLLIPFLERMCSQSDRNGEFLKDDASKRFQSLGRWKHVEGGGPSFTLRRLLILSSMPVNSQVPLMGDGGYSPTSMCYASRDKDDATENFLLRPNFI